MKHDFKKADKDPAQKDLHMPNRLSDTYPWYPDRVMWARQMTPAQKKRSDAFVDSLYELAPKVPVLKAALAWADAHGVTIALDPYCIANGYYWSGSGCVFVSSRLVNPDGRTTAEGVGVAVHELRHAWQDFYGMLSDGAGKDIATSMMQLALYEADASAHQALAREQCSIIALNYSVNMYEQRMKDPQFRKHQNAQDMAFASIIKNGRDKTLRELSDPKTYLWKAFCEWYNPYRAGDYGRFLVGYQGEAFGVPGLRKVSFKPFFNKEAHPKHAPGIDVYSRADLMRLGKSFDGTNYMRAADWDWMQKFPLNPAMAKRFYDLDKKHVAPGVNDIEKRQRALALANKEKAALANKKKPQAR